MNNPMYSAQLMQAQLLPEGSVVSPSISRQKTKEIFYFSEEKKVDSLKRINSEDQLEVMVEMMVEQSKLTDEMYEKYGVDEEEFNTAMLHYNLQNDPEITAIIM
jgi:hypothetical protein